MSTRNRKELDEHARSIGIENPEGFANMGLLEAAIAAIEPAPSTPEEVGRPELADVAAERAATREKNQRVIGAPVDQEV